MHQGMPWCDKWPVLNDALCVRLHVTKGLISYIKQGEGRFVSVCVCERKSVQYYWKWLREREAKVKWSPTLPPPSLLAVWFLKTPIL